MVLEQPWRWAEGNHLSGGVHFPHSLWSPLLIPLGPISILDCPTKMPERAPCSQLPSHQHSLERRSPLPHAHAEKTGTPMGSHQASLCHFWGAPWVFNKQWFRNSWFEVIYPFIQPLILMCPSNGSHWRYSSERCAVFAPCEFTHQLRYQQYSEKRYVCAQSLQSCPTLCHPMDCSLPGSSVHGILQASILEWIAMSFSRASSWPRDWTRISWVSCTADRFFTTESLGKPQ